MPGKFLLVALATSTFMAGCSMAPGYVRPGRAGNRVTLNQFLPPF